MHKRLVAAILAVITLACFIGYQVKANREEAYYRTFYRADIAIDQCFVEALQSIYEVVVESDYDKDTIQEFFGGEGYTQARGQMQEALAARTALYERYPVVDSSALGSMEKNILNVTQFADYINSEVFDSEVARSYFFLLGLSQDMAVGIAEINEWMEDPMFPRKSDQILNPVLGDTR